MTSPRSLRLRAAGAFALFGGIISLLLASGLYFGSRDLGQKMMDEILAIELQDFARRHAEDPQARPPVSQTLRGFVMDGSGPAPLPIEQLTEGYHQLQTEDGIYRLLIQPQRGLRYAMLYNQQQFLERERGFLFMLAGGVLVMIGLSAALGDWLAGRVIRPVTELAERVGSRQPGQRQAPMAEDFPWQEVHDLAHAIDDYQQRLCAFIERERLFTGDISHELRTPLAVIRSTADLIANTSDLPPPQQQRLSGIIDSIDEITEITTALLSLAREPDPRLEPEQAQCDAAEVIRQVTQRLHHLYRAKPLRVDLIINAHPQLPVERALLVMAASNLIRNAFNYSVQGSIRILLDRHALTVSDKGSGIDPELLPQITQRHARGPDSRGAGIGLSLVQRICDRNGWQFGVQSRPGEGTTARIRFDP